MIQYYPGTKHLAGDSKEQLHMFKKLFVRPTIAALVGASLVLSLAAGPAYAGEITGNDKSLKNEDGSLNGRSACAFSGQNDTYSGDPDVPDADGFTRTQNWGQLDKELKEAFTDAGFNPGNACRGNADFEE